jgi:hypothetical protein
MRLRLILEHTATAGACTHAYGISSHLHQLGGLLGAGSLDLVEGLSHLRLGLAFCELAPHSARAPASNNRRARQRAASERSTRSEAIPSPPGTRRTRPPLPPPPPRGAGPAKPVAKGQVARQARPGMGHRPRARRDGEPCTAARPHCVSQPRVLGRPPQAPARTPPSQPSVCSRLVEVARHRATPAPLRCWIDCWAA